MTIEQAITHLEFLKVAGLLDAKPNQMNNDALDIAINALKEREDLIERAYGHIVGQGTKGVIRDLEEETMSKKVENQWDSMSWATKDLVKVCGKNWAMTKGTGREMLTLPFMNYKVTIAQDAGLNDILRIEDENGELVEIFLSEQIKEMIAKGYQNEVDDDKDESGLLDE